MVAPSDSIRRPTLDRASSPRSENLGGPRYARVLVSRASTVIAGLLALGCSTSPPPVRPENPKPAQPTEAAPGTPTALAPPTRRAELPPRPLPDGCTTDLADPGAPEPLLAEVARSCVGSMAPVAPEPLLVTLEPGAARDLPFTITDPNKCIRAAAAGSKGVKELELTIVDRSDRVLGEDTLPGQVALANFDGPICLEDPGQYRAVVRMVDGSGGVAIQVWQAE